MNNFGNTDHQLFVSGLFWDCQVSCEDKVWKLHKSILCTRSGYFKAALSANWPEARDNKVHITKCTKEQMEWVLKYIYTGKVNFAPFQTAGNVLEVCVRLWELGDYFLVPSLCERVQRHLLEDVVPKTARIAFNTNFSINRPDWLAAGQLLYNAFRDVDRFHVLKASFLDISLNKTFVRKEVLNMNEFKELCLEFPGFGNDCMLKLVSDRITRLQ